MTQKLQIALVCVAFVGLSLWTSWPKGEPSWGGKTVSEWLVELAPKEPKLSYDQPEAEWLRQFKDQDRRRKDAQNAIRNIGEPAIPYVLALLDDSPKQLGPLDQLAERLGRKSVEPPTKSVRLSRAANALEALGEKGQPALPTLKRMLNDTNTVRDATTCLASIGVLGVPALTGCLTSSNEQQRLLGLVYLGAMGTNAAAALPVVQAAVQDASPKVASRAVFTYAQIEPDKLKLIAMLLHWTQTNTVNPITLMNAMGAVGVWHRPHGAEVQPLIAELLRFADDSDDKTKAYALSKLAKFGESAAPAKVRALAAIQSDVREVRSAGCQLLAALRLEPETTVPLLIKLAQNDPDEIVRSAALHAAAAFGEAGLPFCGPLRLRVEQAILERSEEDRLWDRITPK